MKHYKLENMIKGWFVGGFSPTAFDTDVCEIAVKKYKAGDAEEMHYHKVVTEITLVVTGRVRMLEKEWVEGDILVLEPGVATRFEALTDVINVVVKLPGVRGDKYSGHSDQTIEKL